MVIQRVPLFAAPDSALQCAPLLVARASALIVILKFNTSCGGELGDGETTSFWYDTWAEDGVLRDALPTLYSHCLHVDVTVAEVGGRAQQHRPPTPPFFGGQRRTGAPPECTRCSRASHKLWCQTVLNVN